MLLALDDTDTRDGGCTTHTAFRIAAALERAGGPLTGWGLSAPPRLVRLNPAAPHKTRGNGALVLPIGPRRAGEQVHVIGRADDRPITTVPVREAPSASDISERLAELVADHLPEAGHNDQDPQPGAILLPRPPDASLYETAVARLVRPLDAWSAAPPGTIRLTPAARRGEIGALAAAAWPRQRWTWESIAYRAADERDAARVVPAHLPALLAALPDGFDNQEPVTGRLRCVPRTPCPVRWGVRGLDPSALLALQDGLGVPDHWLLQTNHGTTDHARFAPAEPTMHGVVRAAFTITGDPARGPGGHLFATARTDTGSSCTLAAYEPTKDLRGMLQLARPGDRLVVLGRCAHDPTVVAIEAFRYAAAAPRVERLANPRCPACGRSMKSIGADAGYRCRPCGARAPASAASTRTALGPAIGTTHQVPDHVRGHLLPPRGGIGRVRTLDGVPGPHLGPVALDDLPAPLVTAQPRLG